MWVVGVAGGKGKSVANIDFQTKLDYIQIDSSKMKFHLVFDENPVNFRMPLLIYMLGRSLPEHL